MLGMVPKLDWLVTDWALGQFGDQRSEAARRYEDFVRAGVGLPSIWEGLTGQIFLGNEKFADEMRKARDDGDRLREIPPSATAAIGQAFGGLHESWTPRDGLGLSFGRLYDPGHCGSFRGALLHREPGHQVV